MSFRTGQPSKATAVDTRLYLAGDKASIKVGVNTRAPKVALDVRGHMYMERRLRRYRLKMASTGPMVLVQAARVLMKERNVALVCSAQSTTRLSRLQVVLSST